ncbi:MAG: amidohydrolase family protein [Burkholderiaceae bacterium]
MSELGMHAQIWIHAPDLIELAPRFKGLKIPLVIDHMGRMNTALGADNPGFRKLCELMKEGAVWTKISGADRNSNERPEYNDIDVFAKSVLKANLDHVVWGTDWPHINYFNAADVPNDGVLLNTLHRWVPEASIKKQILVNNPARLYGF